MNEIKRGLLAYLMGEQSFGDFQEWLTDLSWAPVNKFTPADVERIREIELRMAEFTGGYLTQDEFRATLRDIVGITPRVLSFLWAMESSPDAVVRSPTSRSSGAPVRQKAAF